MSCAGNIVRLYGSLFERVQVKTNVDTIEDVRRLAAASPGEQRAARRMVEAAHELFVARGYAATTIAAIAETADVSVPTVYAGFAGKADLLKHAIDVAIAGDTEPVAVRGSADGRVGHEAARVRRSC